jgi:hypothetical protein
MSVFRGAFSSYICIRRKCIRLFARRPVLFFGPRTFSPRFVGTRYDFVTMVVE